MWRAAALRAGGATLVGSSLFGDGEQAGSGECSGAEAAADALFGGLDGGGNGGDGGGGGGEAATAAAATLFGAAASNPFGEDAGSDAPAANGASAAAASYFGELHSDTKDASGPIETTTEKRPALSDHSLALGSSNPFGDVR